MTDSDTFQKGRNFERRVAHLFTLLGYSVSLDHLIGGRQVDLIIEHKSGPLLRKYIVECKDQAEPLTTAQYDSFRGRLLAAKRELGPKTQGIMVSSVGFVKEAKAQSVHEEIELLTISELESSVIDFSRYVSILIKQLSDDISLKFFVKPKAKREEMLVPEFAFDIFSKWLADPVANQLTLLGDFGTGKTTLLKYLALNLAQDYLEKVIKTGAHARVPIFINLRDYTKAISLKQLILDFLDSNAIHATSYAAFEYMLHEGYILLIIDGFDEMASRGDQQATLRSFRELNRVAIRQAKILLSCRTHYFTTQHEMRRYHGSISINNLTHRTYTDLYREIAARPNYMILHLLDFDSQQVDQYIKSRCGTYSEGVIDFITTTYNLPELSRRPVLLDMIVSSHTKLRHNTEAITPGVLYTAYTDIWLNQNDWCSILDIEAKSALLELFADTVASTPDKHVNYSQLISLVRKWRDDLSGVDASEVDRELRTASFLVRDDEGNYRFSHKSFFEFFYARFLLKNATANEDSNWSRSYFSTEIYRFVRDLIPSYPIAADILVGWIRDPGRTEFVRTNAIKCIGGFKHPLILQSLFEALHSAEQDRVRWSSAAAIAYYSNDACTEQLVRSFNSDSSIYVRSNCIASLIRMNRPSSNNFLKPFIHNTNSDDVRSMTIRPIFYWALKSCNDKSIVDIAIERAPVIARSRETAPAILDLIKSNNPSGGIKYCERLLNKTTSPIIMASALAIIPANNRLPFIGKAMQMVRKYYPASYICNLIQILGELKRKDIETFLVELMEKGRPPAAQIALTSLSNNFPRSIVEFGTRWALEKSRVYKLRVAVAIEYSRLAGAIGLDLLVQLLSEKERVLLVRRVALELILEHHPNAVVNSIVDIWNDGMIPGLAQPTLEILLKCAADTAVTLMLNIGLRARRTGTRVAVCSVLSSVNSVDVTKALLQLLSEDHSKWVRSQALRSLCIPGRYIKKSDILEASKYERDQTVLNLRREFLGV